MMYLHSSLVSLLRLGVTQVLDITICPLCILDNLSYWHAQPVASNTHPHTHTISSKNRKRQHQAIDASGRADVSGRVLQQFHLKTILVLEHLHHFATSVDSRWLDLFDLDAIGFPLCSVRLGHPGNLHGTATDGLVDCRESLRQA